MCVCVSVCAFWLSIKQIHNIFPILEKSFRLREDRSNSEYFIPVVWKYKVPETPRSQKKVNLFLYCRDLPQKVRLMFVSSEKTFSVYFCNRHKNFSPLIKIYITQTGGCGEGAWWGGHEERGNLSRVSSKDGRQAGRWLCCLLLLCSCEHVGLWTR